MRSASERREAGSRPAAAGRPALGPLGQALTRGLGIEKGERGHVNMGGFQV